jgi:hypothetical protein
MQILHLHILIPCLVAVVQLLVDVVQMDATLNLSHLIRQLVQQVLRIKRRAATKLCSAPQCCTTRLGQDLPAPSPAQC